MRIAVVVSEFPSLSETFVLNQVTGLLDRGHEVDIVADIRGVGPHVHPAVRAYDLEARTYYAPRVPSFIGRTRRTGKGRAVGPTVGVETPAGPDHRSTSGATGEAVTRGHAVPVGARMRPWNPLSAHRLTQASNRAKEAVRIAWMTAGYWRSLRGRRHYDVVHCHFGGNGRRAVAFRRAGALTGRVVTTFHAYDLTGTVHDYGPAVYRGLFRHGDLFLAISEYARQRLVDLGCPESRIRVHRMGIDCRAIRYVPRFPPEGRKTRLLTVARLVEKKGIAYALEAVAMLVADGWDIEYVIVGDGPLRPALEARARALGIGDRVRFRGALTEDRVREELGDAAIFLLPSVTAPNGDQEGIPVVLMEAMASGMPVVATAYAGIPELVEDGRSGCLVPERDAAAIAARLVWLLERPGAWAGIGAHGRARVEADYEIGRLNDQLVNIFLELIDGC